MRAVGYLSIVVIRLMRLLADAFAEYFYLLFFVLAIGFSKKQAPQAPLAGRAAI